VNIGVNTLFLIPGEVGGTETYLCETLDHLTDAPDVSTVLFANRENISLLSERYGRSARVRVVAVPCRAASRPQRILVEQFVLPRHVRHSNVDVLWSPGYTTPLRCPVPMVTTIHDMQYRHHPEDLTLQARLATAILVRGASRRSRLILVPSAFSRDEVVRFTGMPSDRIRITPEAADPTFGVETPAAESARRIAALTRRTAPYVLMVSNTYPHKNVDGGIRAFAALQERIPHDLVLIGKPRLGEPLIQASLAAINDPTRFIRMQRIARSDLVALYQGAAAFLFPSRYEGFGLPVLEAMLAGTPVVTTRGGSIPEIGGEHIWTASPDSTPEMSARLMEALSLPSAERNRRTAAARAHAATFTWQRTAQLTLDALREAASAGHA